MQSHSAFHIHIFMVVFMLLLLCQIFSFYFHYFISRKFTGIDFVDFFSSSSPFISGCLQNDMKNDVEREERETKLSLAVRIILVSTSFLPLPFRCYLYFAITVCVCGNDSYFFSSLTFIL